LAAIFWRTLIVDVCKIKSDIDFCTAPFGKELNSLTLADIKSSFTEERIETDQIEFKSLHPAGNINEKFAGIQRSVCAFLNSSGGLIIWGSPEGQKVEGKGSDNAVKPSLLIGSKVQLSIRY
jgi:hypothetical protein